MAVDNNINNININRINTQKIGRSQEAQESRGREKSVAKSFAEILKETAKANNLIANDIKLRQYSLNIGTEDIRRELVFSKHAKQRLAQRNIDIDFELIDKINGAVKKASEKSIRNALVLSEESAFIVSVDKNIVVTAMNSHEMRENVITNIDGTVIL
ncbi:MAG: flagellar biosynthesis protein [Oscillospiraceae bacterium]|nr:flagellar biosynthesis protein [Oscillospiraceae bacterium]